MLSAWLMVFVMLLAVVPLGAHTSAAVPRTAAPTTPPPQTAHLHYTYDAAGRLTSASYPDGSSEANQYDASGNRIVITSTTPLSGTSVLTNSYDLADELTQSQGTAGTTTYRYDGNGNQLGSLGPTGTVTNTYNDLGQLTQVQGPTTNVSYVYDGQGDRLRSYEQYGPTPVLTNDAQDLAAGMSDLVSDGTADYTYLAPGTGAAPVSAYTQGSTRSTYLATDVLGSVRLATDPTGALIGAGAYDAWGIYRPYTGTGGPTQLAGLQASTPFGYAGQYYDSGPGTYSMRARQYDPTQGRFTSQDPLADQTGQPYQYAADSPTNLSDPSGESANPATDGYFVANPFGYYAAQYKNTIKARFIAADPGGNSFHEVTSPLDSAAFADLVSFNPGRTAGEIYKVVPDLAANTPSSAGWGALALCAPITSQTGVTCNYSGELDALHQLQANADSLSFYGNGSNARPQRKVCRPGSDPTLSLGTDYPLSLDQVLLNSQHPILGPTYNDALVSPIQTVVAGTTVHLFPRRIGPGLIGYSVCTKGQSSALGSLDTPCQDPSISYPAFQSPCAFSGLATGLCVLDVFLGGNLSAYARCGASDQCQEAAATKSLFGVVLSTVTLGAGSIDVPAGTELTIPVATSVGGTTALRAAIDGAAADSSGQQTARIYVDGVPHTLTWQDAATLISSAEAMSPGDWAKLSGMLRAAAQGKGDFGIGTATLDQADALGKAWVGPGYRVSSRDPGILISEKGLRQYRPPSFKPAGPTAFQANLQSRLQDKGPWQNNAHVDILQGPQLP